MKNEEYIFFFDPSVRSKKLVEKKGLRMYLLSPIIHEKS